MSEQQYIIKPENYFYKNGNKKFAYITSIIDNKYIAGAIVLAETIKKLGSYADLIILVTNEITNEEKNLLKNFYDDVVKIKNKNLILIHALNFKYEKIILINCNSIILKYPDYLFTQDTPSCIEYKNKKSINLMLLSPNQQEFEFALNDIKTYDKTIDKYFFTKYKTKWNKINSFFLDNQDKAKINKSFGIIYSKIIPFVLENSISIDKRIKDETLQLWYKFYLDITNRLPELLKIKILTDANFLSKFFIAPLSRKIFNYQKILSDGLAISVSQIFNIEKPLNYYFYHINTSKEYDNDEINYLFEDNSIIDMINNIKNNSSYWTNISKQIMKYKDNKEILDNLQIEDKENILSYYAKINANISIILLITPQNEKIDYLNDYTTKNIIYQKKIILNGSILKNILFNIKQHYTYDERIQFLNSQYVDAEEYQLHIFLYETLIDCNLQSNIKNLFVFSDTNSKVRFTSIFFNKNTMSKFASNQIGFFQKNNIQSLNALMYQSLKKWIYNNYDGHEMDNVMVISEFDFLNENLTNKFVLLDTNIYTTLDDATVQYYNKRKLIFMDIIFSTMIDKKSSKYMQVENYINNIHNPQYYYQIDGIKFIL